jgi:enoyl-CoA hydratase/carnithine racemase
VRAAVLGEPSCPHGAIRLSVVHRRTVALLLAASACCLSLDASGQPPTDALVAATSESRRASPQLTSKVRLIKHSAEYWKVTLANPPLNIIGPSEVPELVKILEQIEADALVKVVVFDSAVPGYFSAHYDLLTPLEESTGMKPGPTGMHPVPDFMVRLSRLPIVTIASIRGRATGIGSELVLATDMRFASREQAILSQWEVGAGLVAGGGPQSRLPRLVGAVGPSRS